MASSSLYFGLIEGSRDERLMNKLKGFPWVLERVMKGAKVVQTAFTHKACVMEFYDERGAGKSYVYSTVLFEFLI